MSEVEEDEAVSRRTESKGRKDDGSVCCFFPLSFSFSILVVKGWDFSILGSVTYTPMPGVDSLHTNIMAP